MINRDRALIVDDDCSTLNLIADTFAVKEHLNPGTGLMWGFLISVFIWFILGIVLAVLL
jgi:hypothetical protein